MLRKLLQRLKSMRKKEDVKDDVNEDSATQISIDNINSQLTLSTQPRHSFVFDSKASSRTHSFHFNVLSSISREQPGSSQDNNEREESSYIHHYYSEESSISHHYYPEDSEDESERDEASQERSDIKSLKF